MSPIIVYCDVSRSNYRIASPSQAPAAYLHHPFTFLFNMFKAGQPNPYDEVVGKHTIELSSSIVLMSWAAKTTDENLTSENWEMILNLCDKVVDEGETGQVITIVISESCMLTAL